MWSSQGSVLGPLIFLVCIYDIPKSGSEDSFHLYVDNKRLFFADKNIRRLEAKVKIYLIRKILNWLKANKLMPNVDKSQLFLDLSLCPNKADAVNIQINSQKLEQSKSIRYIGVVTDDKLNWKSHIIKPVFIFFSIIL